MRTNTTERNMPRIIYYMITVNNGDCAQIDTSTIPQQVINRLLDIDREIIKHTFSWEIRHDLKYFQTAAKSGHAGKRDSLRNPSDGSVHGNGTKKVQLNGLTLIRHYNT